MKHTLTDDPANDETHNACLVVDRQKILIQIQQGHAQVRCRFRVCLVVHNSLGFNDQTASSGWDRIEC